MQSSVAIPVMSLTEHFLYPLFSRFVLPAVSCLPVRFVTSASPIRLFLPLQSACSCLPCLPAPSYPASSSPWLLPSHHLHILSLGVGLIFLVPDQVPRLSPRFCLLSASANKPACLCILGPASSLLAWRHRQLGIL